jgi:hypothetical protein
LGLRRYALRGAMVERSPGRRASSRSNVSINNPVRQQVRPWNFGALVQSGFGVTEDRGGFTFFMAGVHAGKVLTGMSGHGMLRGNFEYGWSCFRSGSRIRRSSQRQNCTVATGPFGGQGAVCTSAPFPIGGTFTGVSITPIILRWNFAGTDAGAVGAGRGRLAVDEPQVSGVRRAADPQSGRVHLQYTGRQRAERRYQRVELHAAVWRGSALLYTGEPIDRPGGERDPYLERVAGRQEPRGSTQACSLPWDTVGGSESMPSHLNPNAVIECVPNFSEGTDEAKVASIVAAMQVDGVRLLDWSLDAAHNRSVVTIAGSPSGVVESAVRGVGRAAQLIDLTRQKGEHPRIGAADVVPFVPVSGVSLAECAMLARQAGLEIWRRYGVPVYFYEAAAARPDRVNLEDVRRGQFEGLLETAHRDAARRPDVGGPEIHPTAGASAVGARAF